MSLPFIHSFSNTTIQNDLLYADTSFVWESHGTTNGQTPPRQIECHNFSTKAIQNGSVFVISPMVEHELKNVAIKELLKKHGALLNIPAHHRKKIISNVPNFMADAHNHVDQIMNILSADPNFVILDKDAPTSLSSKLSAEYNMDLNDSIILATMLSNSINSIVTLDGDYIEVHDQNLQIYTNQQNYLKIVKAHPSKIANTSSNNLSSSGS